MKNIKADDLILFYRVAELKNFSQAADRVGIVKSMVSKRISRLESALGVRLLNRSTRSMSLTEVGEMVYGHALRMNTEFQAILQSIEETKVTPSGHLKVLAPLSFGSYTLAKISAGFIQAFPSITVDTVLSAYHKTDLIQSNFDVAIQVGPPTDSNNLYRQLAKRQLAVCAAPAYFEQHGYPQNLSDLKKHNCLVHQHLPESNAWKFLINGKSKTVIVDGNYTSNSSHALKHAAIEGLGIAMLPDYTIHSEIQDNKLQSIFTEFCPYAIDIYAIYPYTHHVAPKLSAYLDYLSKELNTGT